MLNHNAGNRSKYHYTNRLQTALEASERRTMWRRLVEWMSEPIAFPGKTYDLIPPGIDYNQEMAIFPPSSPGFEDERASKS